MSTSQLEHSQADLNDGLPPEWAWVQDSLDEEVLKGALAKTYGLTPESDSYLVFHGTMRDKLPAIMREGLKAFLEEERKTPRVFVTASPTRAILHAIEQGPHDTLRASGQIDYDHRPEDAVLLAVRVPKLWLASQPESQRPLPHPKWFKTKFLPPGEDKLLHGFIKGLTKEVRQIEEGMTVSDFGIAFPTDMIPPKFIRIIDPGSHFIFS